MYKRFIVSLSLPVEKALGWFLILVIIKHSGVITCEAVITVFLAHCVSEL